MLVVTWYNNGKHEHDSSCVSLADKTDAGLFPVDISGVSGYGSCYGDALEDFICEFDKKMDELKAFREMLDKQYHNQHIVYVDCCGKEINRT